MVAIDSNGSESLGSSHVRFVRGYICNTDRRTTAHLQKKIERVAKVGEELVPGVEPLRGREAHVVHVQRVGDDEVRLAVLGVPVGEVVVVGVRIVQETALLYNEPDLGQKAGRGGEGGRSGQTGRRRVERSPNRPVRLLERLGGLEHTYIAIVGRAWFGRENGVFLLGTWTQRHNTKIYVCVCVF